MNQRSKTVVSILLAAIVAIALLFLGLGLYLALSDREAVQEKAPIVFFAGEAAEDAPDMVLIVLDALRADRVGAERNGVALTPFLDRLCEEGAFFSDAMTACTWTRPAMASLFTSNYVESHEVVFAAVDEAAGDEQTALPSDRAVLAGLLSAGGYSTAGVQTNGNLFPVMGFDRGFGAYVSSLDGSGRWVTDESLKALKTLSSPFFLYAHYMSTHVPYESPESYRELLGYRPDALPAGEREIVEDFKDYYVAWCHYAGGREDAFPFAELSEAGKEAARLLYDASVRYVDDEVRRLVEGVWEKSPEAVVVVLSDHGEHFWDHGLLGHSLSLYDCELRIPLIIHGGKTPAGRQERLTEIVDVAPTLLRLAGLEKPKGWQGKDLFEADPRPGFSRTQSDSPAWKIELDAVVTDEWKLILNGNKGDKLLFNRRTDPEESQDLSAEQPETVSSLLGMLHRHRAENLRLRTGHQSQVTVDEETMEQLRQLGYMN